MSKDEEKKVAMKDGLEFSVTATNQAMRESAMVSALANQWATANIPYGILTDENGNPDPKAIEQAANVSFLFASKMVSKSNEYFNDAVNRIEAEIIAQASNAETAEARIARMTKTKGGIILPTGNMMREHLRPDQKDFLTGGLG